VKVYIQQQYPEFIGIMVAVGKGEAEPRTDNLTEASRARNRRVEIVVR
jgi:outer membrane protein OmpA-like peptidoglycan-associated protein